MFEDNIFDVVFSCFVMEYFYDNDFFVSEMYRIFKLGGICIYVLLGKYVLFLILNRLLFNKVIKKLVEWVFLEWKGELGFVVYYYYCLFFVL